MNKFFFSNFHQIPSIYSWLENISCSDRSVTAVDPKSTKEEEEVLHVLYNRALRNIESSGDINLFLNKVKVS